MYSAFCLIDVIEMNKQNPRNYLLPSEDELNNIEIGDLVKIVLRHEESINNWFKDERIWVKVISLKDAKITGMLEENSMQVQMLKKGDVVIFKGNNITDVKKDTKETIDGNKSAFITNRAMQHGQINWVVRTTPLNKQDSGWQLFYGDEDYEYLDNPSNMETITIKEVLNFEPLLEDIFLSRFDSAEYNSKLNRFIEI